MKAIQIRSKILSEKGEGIANKKISVEVFDLDTNAWKLIGSTKSNTTGIANMNVSFAQEISQAPNLRLVESGSNPVRVLAQHCYLRYIKRSQTLTCDFGEIEYLDDSAYKINAVLSIFRNDKTVLSGQARRPDISALTAVRTALLSTGSRVISSEAVVTTNVPTGVITSADDLNVSPSMTLDTYNSEILKLTANQAQLQDTIRLRNLDLQAKQQELDTTAAEAASLKVSIKALEEDNKQLQSSIKTLEEKNLSFTDEEKRLSPIETVAATIGAQLDKANKTMRDASQPYRIQNIAVELNGSISQDGKSIALTRLSDAKEGAQETQKVKIDLVSSNATEAVEVMKVPDLSGLTESMARRLLKSLGLKLEALDKSVGEDSSHTIGQLISQSPNAGDEQPVSGSVIGVFAKI